jgi:YjbE family integral membrane protein
MEQFALTHDLAALAQVILIDVILAGDNAVVVGMAVAGLPQRQKQLAILSGILGATVIRIVLSVIALRLLAIIGLLLAGGLLLLWVCWKMFRDLYRHRGSTQGTIGKRKTLGQAMVQIILADASMSLDNVLAVAAAAHGNFVLIVFGIGLSLPIVVWGAGWLARLMNRYRWIVWLGGGILGKVAGQMILEDRLVSGWPLAHAIEYDLPGGIVVNVHPLPLALGAAIMVIGWWFGRRRHVELPENV